MIAEENSLRGPERTPTSTVDRFGNRVVYEYQAKLPPSGAYADAEEFVLSKIEYGTNNRVWLGGDFALISFRYEAPATCAGTDSNGQLASGTPEVDRLPG